MTGNALGGDVYWASGLHLYTPLPFRPGKGGFGDFFRSHFFVNAGNVYNIQTGRNLVGKIVSSKHVWYSVIVIIETYHSLLQIPRLSVSF